MLIHFPSVWLYISAILGGCFINGSIPLFYELTIETTYPIAEGIPMAVVTTSNHLFCLLFLAALMIPGIGEMTIYTTVIFTSYLVAYNQIHAGQSHYYHNAPVRT